MGRLLKKKKHKTKGRKPRKKDQLSAVMDELIITSTPTSKDHIAKQAYVNNAIDSFGVRDGKLEITEIGSEEKTFIDITGNKVSVEMSDEGTKLNIQPDREWLEAEASIWDEMPEDLDEVYYDDPSDNVKAPVIEDNKFMLYGEPQDMTMKWSDMPDEPITNACSEVELPENKFTYKPVDPDEIAHKIRALHKNYGGSASKTIKEAVERVARDLSDAITDEEAPESEEDYFLSYQFAENPDRNNEATEESINFLSDMGAFLGFGDLTEMIAEATERDMQEIYDQRFTQAYVSHTIRWGRQQIRESMMRQIDSRRGSGGRCQSIW